MTEAVVARLRLEAVGQVTHRMTVDGDHVYWLDAGGMSTPPGVVTSLSGRAADPEDAIVNLYALARSFDRLVRHRKCDGARLEYVWTGNAWRVDDEVTR